MKIKQFFLILILLGSIFIFDNAYSMRYFSVDQDTVVSEVAGNFYRTLKVDVAGNQQIKDFLDDNKALIIGKIKPIISNVLSQNSCRESVLKVAKKRLGEVAKGLGDRICNTLSQGHDTVQLQEILSSENIDFLRKKLLANSLRDTICKEMQPSQYSKSCKTIGKGCLALTSFFFLFCFISGLFYPATRADAICNLKCVGIPTSLWALDYLLGKRLPLWINPVGAFKTIFKGCIGFSKKEKLKKEDFE